VMDVATVPNAFRLPAMEAQLGQTVSVRDFVRRLASSEAYGDRYVKPFPTNKTVDLLFRHLLGREVATDLERLQYGQLLQEDGLAATVETIVMGSEYGRFFGEDTVPYHRGA
jgi:phycobilisome core-membrane linker protein